MKITWQKVLRPLSKYRYVVHNNWEF